MQTKLLHMFTTLITQPDEKKWIVVCDLGIDTVFTYRRTETGLEEVAQYKTKAGSGPRHLAFHPTFPIAYLIWGTGCYC